MDQAAEFVSTIMSLKDARKERSQGGIEFHLSIPDVSIKRGMFVAIVGDSGCGKSTLLDMLALVSRPTEWDQFVYRFLHDSGDEIHVDVGGLWDTEDEAGLAGLRRSKMGYVLQTGGLLPFLTVGQNIRLPSLLSESTHLFELDKMLEQFGLKKGLHMKKPQFLSGGQRQRVAILRALAHRPQIILADEPTAAVDKTRAKKIVADFDVLAKDSGSTIIMVTHDYDLVANIADLTFTFKVEDLSESLTNSTVYAV